MYLVNGVCVPPPKVTIPDGGPFLQLQVSLGAQSWSLSLAPSSLRLAAPDTLASPVRVRGKGYGGERGRYRLPLFSFNLCPHLCKSLSSVPLLHASVFIYFTIDNFKHRHI